MKPGLFQRRVRGVAGLDISVNRKVDPADRAAKLEWSKSKYAAIESGEQQLKFLEFGQIAKVLDLDFMELAKRYADLVQKPEFPPPPRRPRKK